MIKHILRNYGKRIEYGIITPHIYAQLFADVKIYENTFIASLLCWEIFFPYCLRSNKMENNEVNVQVKIGDWASGSDKNANTI